jgi:hypothetical protein
MTANRFLGIATSRHPEGDVAAVADDLRADLDQLLFEARQRRFLIGSGVALSPPAPSVSSFMRTLAKEGKGAIRWTRLSCRLLEGDDILGGPTILVTIKATRG